MYYPGICMEGLRKTTKTLSQDDTPVRTGTGHFPEHASRPAVANLIHLEGQILTYRTPSRARSSVSFRKAAWEYCPPKLSQSQIVKKTTAFKPMCLNFTLHQ
jgi:hypothetical protein